jgi:hypothetical protein
VSLPTFKRSVIFFSSPFYLLQSRGGGKETRLVQTAAKKRLMAWQTRGENSARDYNSLLPVVSPLSEGSDLTSKQITEEELSNELQARS